jgi:hypothetical protein
MFGHELYGGKWQMGQLVMDAKQLGGRSHIVCFRVDSFDGDGSRCVMERPICGGWHVDALFGGCRKAILHWVFVRRRVGGCDWDWLIIVWDEMGAGKSHWICLGGGGVKSGL